MEFQTRVIEKVVDASRVQRGRTSNNSMNGVTFAQK